MATKATDSELLELEEHALEHLEEEGLPPQELLVEPEGEPELPLPVLRIAFVISFGLLAAAMMIGGVFKGISPRVWASVSAFLGVTIAVFTGRIRNVILMNLAVVLGIFAVGVVISLPSGSLDDIINLTPFIREAVGSGDVLRPPVTFTLGWQAIVGWLMGGLGFAAAWIAIQMRRPAMGLFATLPLVAIGAISVPDDQKILSGIAALVFIAIGLGLLSGIEAEGEQRSLAYELRRAVRALPMIAGISVLLYIMASNRILFPQPLIDPTQSAQRPKTVPLTEVPDRVLFTVRASITGPWRMGALDIYKEEDGEFAWYLPPFADNRLTDVPRDGRVDTELQSGFRADIEIGDIGGAVLPGLPNLVGLVAEGPRLAFDYRTGNIRLSEGQIQAGLKYTVVAARIPTIEELRNVDRDPSNENCISPPRARPVRCSEFMEVPDPPPGIRDLISRAPSTSPWDKLDFVRTGLLNAVVSEGPGTPKEVPPSKVQDMIFGSKKGTPFEIVAAQALLARWVGIPSRIGYGFDGGECAGEGKAPPCSSPGVPLEVRPKHGSSFLEVYFPGYKWLPIIGTPVRASTSIGGQQQTNESVLASDDIAVKVYLPFQIDPRTFLFEQVRRVISIVVPIVLLLLAAYYLYPGVRKWIHRTRRRVWAQDAGLHERIAVAYADWRDLATDFGYQFASDTPLMFLGRVVEDDEHSELAWLVTRGLWGDLRGSITDTDAAAAEELSKSLRKRLSQAHTFTLRFIAMVSRLSLKHSYAPKLGIAGKERQQDVAA